ncbi:MAG TPA: alginate lyase family protein, partial [Longimicrobiales bacterium]
MTLRSEALEYARAHRNDAALRPAFDALIRAANQALTARPIVVTDKKRLLPPSNDAHDYFSLSPYWWPDPSKPDGLPYIRRDGQTNPESKRDLDQPRVAAMGDRVQALALAYYLTGDERYARAAAKQVRAWFLDPATRMNPHLRFSQLVRGNPNERGSGIIDTRWFIEVVDGVGMIRGSRAWTARDQQQLQAWFRRYLDWLLASPNGAHERVAKNNHGSWYAAQTASYALFVGDTAKAREIVEAARSRIAAQIQPDGNQPEEMVRTRSLHYSAFNVEALGRVAEIGRKLGIDLWNHRAPSGGSLRIAATHVAQYVGREDQWPGNQITRIEAPVMLQVLRRVQLALGDRAFADAIARINQDTARADRSLLLFASAATTARSTTSYSPPREGESAMETIIRRTTGQNTSARRSDPRAGIFLSATEASELRNALGRYPLLDRSYADARAMLDSAFAHPIDVPPPGEAGGYEHERHKQNYREMQAAGLLYRITSEERYARFVRDMLEKYAVLYPTLGAHPLAKNQAPGKLFHQSLNEANWLAAVAIAYDCVYDYLQPAERARIEKNVLRPMADWLSVTQAKEFDRIHNHGTWATASVGMLGLVLNDSSYVNRALYGTKRDRSGGFLRQLDLLFSPDGYYMEGPYYIRYALMPFFYFAEALDRERPDVGIYKYRDGILLKGLQSAILTAFPNGVFPPINDASRTMDITSPEVVLATDLAY